jgi:hypothetical protein
VRSGGLSEQGRSPTQHGPYYQVSFAWQGRTKSEFVPREQVTTVRQHLRNYQRLRKLVENWIAPGLELSKCVWRTRPPHDRIDDARLGQRAHGPPSRLKRTSERAA